MAEVGKPTPPVDVFLPLARKYLRNINHFRRRSPKNPAQSIHTPPLFPILGTGQGEAGMKASMYTKRVQRQLRRIVALLLALAGLAERAAGRSAPVRLLAVWFLRRGETAARDHVLALTGRVVSAPVPARLPDAADALRLAENFRALAAALAAFAAALARSAMSEIAIVSGKAAGFDPEFCDALAASADASLPVERLDSS